MLLWHAYLIVMRLAPKSNKPANKRKKKNKVKTRDGNLRNRFADNFYCSGLCRRTPKMRKWERRDSEMKWEEKINKRE